MSLHIGGGGNTRRGFVYHLGHDSCDDDEDDDCKANNDCDGDSDQHGDDDPNRDGVRCQHPKQLNQKIRNNLRKVWKSFSNDFVGPSITVYFLSMFCEDVT